MTPPSTWKKIAIDLIGPYNDKTGKPLSDAGYKYVLTFIDFFSNYTEAFPLYTKNASEIAENLYTLFCRHGVPLEMISDNGGEFNSKLSGVIYDMYGYKHIKITPYNPQANGKCERYNQTLKNMLNKTVKEETNLWERFLPKCLFSYNTSKHSSTNFSPFYLMYWRNPLLPNEQSIGNTVNTFQSYEELNQGQIEDCAIK
ncbi:unnamed protein product [Mytilus coruscus]|uniref:Integrase catalytic domain-containing protein n=1 Tax=Mytilus coruscus TaxID=42192 RepID=A0A6J8ECU9_MYTCO|nr:unnamed protein product [Mytilus coruscus]